MKKTILTLVLSCILIIPAISQTLTIKSVETKLITNQGVEFFGKIVEKEKNDIYLNTTWRNTGELHVDGKEYIIRNINFNISKSEVSCKLKNGKYFVFSSTDVRKFKINDQLFKKNGRLYYEVLVEEDNTYFYKRYDVRYQEGVTHRIGGGTVGSGRMSTSFAYLIKNGSESKTIELNKKSVLSLFDDQQEELKKFVKENHLSYKNEKDLITIVSHMLKIENKIS
ncbi:MAG: hypothetical protein COB73_05105 [Flavobacteriaceae bacterium]|nr:MAG: hypothetical protein COB73_05105 [Flavobacteriaceae bacterium]